MAYYKSRAIEPVAIIASISRDPVAFRIGKAAVGNAILGNHSDKRRSLG